MAVPTAPAAGEPIAEAWGDVVHDTAVAMDIQVGTVNVSLANAASGTATVTFPRPFASAPIVVASAAFVTVVHFAAVATITPTTFIAQLVRKDTTLQTTTQPVTWIAYGPRA